MRIISSLPRSAPPRRLLLVDDDGETRELVEAWGRRAYALTAAATLEEGRRALRAEAVDLIVLESRLPDGSGLSLLAEVARAHPALPSIMMTAHGSEEICTLAFKLGVDDYLRKPVDRTAFLAAVGPFLMPPPAHHARPLRGPAPSGRSAARARGRMQQRIQDAVRFVQDHHAEHLTLADVARTVGVGKFTLSHGFSALMRVPFRTYLMRVRVLRAAELLRRSSHSVIDISEMVGFGDLSRFNKAFKKHIGLPPTVYRRIVAPSMVPDRLDTSA